MKSKKSLCLWVGIDVGKREFAAAIDVVVNETKTDILELPCKVFQHSEKGVINFLQWVDETIPAQPFKVVMETTGHYSVNLCELLQSKRKGLECCIANSYQTANFLKSLNLLHKTDSIDAQCIARFGTERQPPVTVLLSKEEKELQEMARQRDQLVSTKVVFENRHESLYSESMQQQNKELIKTLKEHIAQIENDMKKLIEKNEDKKKQTKLMQTIPGVGSVTAFALTAEFGNFKNHTRQELSAMSGLAPRLRESGTSVKSSRISRRGPVSVRRLLFMCTNHSIRKIPYLNAMYTRLTLGGKTKMQAKCACMRVLLLIIRSVVVNERSYSEEFSYQTLAKQLQSA